MQLTNRLTFWFIVFQALVLFTNCPLLSGQNSAPKSLLELKKKFDKVYGVDYTLVNGRKYVNFYGSAEGHPFLNDPEFEIGWIELKGTIYEYQLINYDIYNQELIVEYDSDLIGKQRYIIPNIFLEAFGMGEREFVKLKLQDREKRFYELISTGKDSLLLTHEKMYSINRNANSQGFLFSPTITRNYLLQAGNLRRIKNNRSFRKSFPLDMQNDLKSFMKVNRIKIRKADPLLLKRLMNYI
ncbi:MAG: hypothetical protein ACP5E3_15205, partial [Bacteroidales bacterium]